MLEKKVVILIVEGPSDKDALEYYLEKLSATHRIHFHVTNGDILYKKTEIQKIVNRAMGRALDELRKNKILPGDVSAVFMITDTDGVFISDDRLTITPKRSKFHYAANTIEVPSESAKKDAIENRTDRRACLNLLHRTPSIKYQNREYDFGIYYFSCNLEHCTLNNPNTNDKDKCERAVQFASSIKSIKEFIAFFEPFAVAGTYDETWAYIKERNHSLSRCTNIQLLIDKLITA